MTNAFDLLMIFSTTKKRNIKMHMLSKRFDYCFHGFSSCLDLNFTGNGYKNVKFHVEGNLSDYAANDIKIIQETIASFVGCDKKEIHLNGFCRSNSFLVVLSMKERYVNGLFNMKQQDKEKLILLNIHYFIVDSKYIYLKHSKGNFCMLDLKTYERFSDHFIS